jgi:hypothetical protein
MKDEFAQYKKKGSLSEYFSETQNFYDTGVQLTYIAALALDTHHTASDWCCVMYALNFVCVLVVFTY